jgi:nucleoid DNA-binding protein
MVVGQRTVAIRTIIRTVARTVQIALVVVTAAYSVQAAVVEVVEESLSAKTGIKITTLGSLATSRRTAITQTPLPVTDVEMQATHQEIALLH